MSELAFTYHGKAYKMSDVVSEENYMVLEDEGRSINIILKHGIREICDFFGFKDASKKVIYADETKDFGSMIVIELTMQKTGPMYTDLKDAERYFTGTGEISGQNYKESRVPYPFAIVEKRARSRAVLWEIGVNAYGEEESEEFGKMIRAQKYKKTSSFSNTKSAVSIEEPRKAASKVVPATKTTSVPEKAPVAESTAEVNQTDKIAAQKRLQDLKSKAVKCGKNNIDVINALKEKLGIKGMPTLNDLAKDLSIFDEIEKQFS